MSGLGEFDFIQQMLAPLAGDGSFGLTDDAAVLSDLPASERWAVTMDTMVEGIHFLPHSDPGLLARKLLRVNLSDLAAMGARPVGYFLSISCGPGQDEAWLKRFTAGLAKDQQEYGISLKGGDTTATNGPLTLTITALGGGKRGYELRRNGARPGDNLFVSGPLGGAALGLKLLTGEIEALTGSAAIAIAQYNLPRPRLALGQALVRKATACADISDGLIADTAHIARASGVAINIAQERLPMIEELRAQIKAEPSLAMVPLNGGDDYELVFTMPPDAKVPDGVHWIGNVAAGEGVKVLNRGFPVLDIKPGWRHF